LRQVLGTILKETRKFDVNSLSGIRDAYIAAFDDDKTKDATSLFSGSDYQELLWLEATRNVLVHRGGKADKKFISRVKKDQSMAGIKEGNQLGITEEYAVRLSSVTVRSAMRLLTFVDHWLSCHPS
jgi:hypothetical protein